MKPFPLAVFSLALVVGWAGCSKAPSSAAAPAAAADSALMVAAGERSAQFEAVNRHLELGGEMYGYIDVDGDATRATAAFQQMFSQLQQINPAQPKVSAEGIQTILSAIHLEDIKAIGFSSVRETGGEFRNRAFIATPGGRHGVMAIAGGAPGAPRHLKLTPKDADLYEELEFDVPALERMVRQIVVATGGEAGLEKMRQQSETTKATSGFSPLEIAQSLRGRVTLIVRSDPTKTITFPGVPPTVIPRFTLLLGVDGLASALKPMLDKSPFLSGKTDNGRTYYTPKMPMMIEGIRPVLVVDGTDLYLGSDEFFTHECFDRPEADGLAQSWDFQRLMRELGPEVNSIGYMAPRLISTIKLLPNIPGQTKNGPMSVFSKMLDQIPVPARPEMWVTQNLPDGVYLHARASRSLKSQLMAGMMFNPILSGIISGAAMAQTRKANGNDGPTFQRGSNAVPPPTVNRRPPPTLKPDDRVVRNLRLLSILANSYYRRTGADTVKVDELVGPGKLIPALAPVEGEDYNTVQLKKDEPIEITLPNGRTLKYAPPATPPGAPLLPRPAAPSSAQP